MTDIVVIGGGIAGVSVAAALASDAQVTLIEAEPQLGYHSSARSAALTERNYGAPSVQALNRASFDALDQGGYLSARGLLILGRAGEECAFAADMAALGTTAISVAEAVRRVPVLNPDRVKLAGYHEGAFDIDTDRLQQDMARTLRKTGGQIVTNQRVSRISRAGGRWHVQTAGQTFTSTTLVNAAGAWADEIARCAGVAPLGISAFRRSMARLPAPAGHDVSKWPMFFGVGESWYAKPDAGALLVSPAEEDLVEPHDAWADDMRIAEGLARYEDVVTTPVTRVQSTWGGLRSFAPDRSLVLGPDPALPEFVWCVGQGGYGFQTTPAAARLVADLVNGRQPDIPAEFLPALTPDRLR